ncbi:zinc finger CCCH domain-containing protein 3 isoform X2 [Rhinoraja longicauda]
MEERAALERQIRLLSALITNHKNVHGDVPAVTESSGTHWQGPWAKSDPQFTSVCSQKVPGPEPSSLWRTKYSLVNKKPGNSGGEASNGSRCQIIPSSACVQSSARECVARPTESESCNPMAKPERKVQATARGQSLLDLNTELAVKHNKLKEKLDKVKMARKMNGIVDSKLHPGKGSTVKSALKRDQENEAWNTERKMPTKASGNTVESVPYNCHSASVQCSAKTQVETRNTANPEASRYKLKKSHVQAKVRSIAGETAQGAGTVRPIVQSNGGVKLGKLQDASSSPDQVQCSTSSIKKSKYTWQKGPELDMNSASRRCQNETLKAAKETVSNRASPVQTSSVIGGSLKSKSPLSLKVLKKQRTSSPLCNGVGKGRKAKYVWVSNTTQFNQPLRPSEVTRKSVSPKLAKSTIKRVMGSNATLDLDAGVRSTGKHKKAANCQRIGLSSKYCWKAVETGSPSKSLYQWKSQDPYNTRSSGHQVKSVSLRRAEFAIGGPKKALNEPASSHYKLKSTTKIIRRNGGLSSPTEKKLNLGGLPIMKSRYLLIKKSPVHGKSPTVVKRTPGKGLVQVSKHRLRRLPTSGPHSATKQGLNSLFPVKSPSSNRLINTRYKIVKKNAGWNTSLPAASLGISWKTKKFTSSYTRSPLLNRARLSSSYRFLQQRWKTKGMRCIGGVLYRVSANKLAKSSSTPTKPAATSSRGAVKSAVRLEPDFDNGDLCLPGSLTKVFSHRHIARFLRGTCKQTDGTCPFSHKVSKDKMPVCSYYLKGICSNNNCPYSHVYVSRKAEVCKDFLKGYCPLGPKCKRKHTLLCPEFSKTGNCTQGSKCKLRHRQPTSHKQKAASDSSQAGASDRSTTSKRISPADHTLRNKEKISRQVNSGDIVVSSSTSRDVSGSSSGQQRLPAFIALHSSVSSEEKADSDVEEEREGEALGKPIQIKPRF